MKYGQRYLKREEMDGWPVVAGFCCRECGTPAKENPNRAEWGCEHCEFVSSHRAHPPREGVKPFFVRKSRRAEKSSSSSSHSSN